MKKFVQIGIVSFCVVSIFFMITIYGLSNDMNLKNLPISDVSIDSFTRTIIWGKLADGSKVEILNVAALPKESKNPSGFALNNAPFRFVALSPDKNKIAFSCGTGNEWSGIYDLNTKRIKQLSFFFDSSSGELFWSPNGKYIAEEYEGADGYYKIRIKDIESNTNILTIDPSFLEKRKIKIGRESLTKNFKEGVDLIENPEIHFYKWGPDSKKVFFEISRVEYLRYPIKMRKPQEKIKDIRLGRWSINTDNFNLMKVSE